MPNCRKIAKHVSKMRKALDGDAKDVELMKKTFKKHLDEVDKQIAGHAAKKACVRDPAVPSQFERKRPVIDAMADFAGWEHGSAHSRVDITKAICEYIAKKDLQIPGNRIYFRVDDQLKKIIPVANIDLNIYDDDSKTVVHGKRLGENVVGPSVINPWLRYPALQKHIAAMFAA